MKTIALVMLGTFLALSGSADARPHRRRGHAKGHVVIVVQEPTPPRVVVVAPPRPSVVISAPSVTISH